MVDKVFLTEKRRDVLNGESDLKGNSLAVSKSRIRKRARIALKELTEVAESNEIDNSDIFEQNEVAGLLHAILTPSDGLTPLWSYDGTPTEHLEEYSYERSLATRIDHTIDGYVKMLTREHHPSEEPIKGFDIDLDD